MVRLALVLAAAPLANAKSAGFSPLVDAARTGDVAAIARLAAEGTDLDASSGRNGWTPLLHAIHKNRVGAVRALLRAGADVDRSDASGRTPLIMAAGYGYASLVGELLEAGADPWLETRSGDNALSIALTGVTDIDRFTFGACQTETVRALLEHAPTLHVPERGWGRWSRPLAWFVGCTEALALLNAAPVE